MWYIHTMDHNLVVKSNKVLIQPTILINLEKIVLSERKQTQNDVF